MYTCEFLILNFGCGPAFFFDGLSGIGQLRRGRAAHEQAFDVRARSGFRPARRFEEKSYRSEAIDDPRFRGVVRRHLEFDAVANC